MPAQQTEITPRYANYALGLLLVVYIFNFIDRQILSILLEDIKADIELTDTELGFLGGIAFALFYTFAGIPIARWADRGSRRTIIAISILIWSIMTAFTGAARGFWMILAAYLTTYGSLVVAVCVNGSMMERILIASNSFLHSL